jgi:DGQHR domain-containing protein
MENVSYCGLRFKQRNDPSSPSFFVFMAPAKSIVKWTGVERTTERAGAVQRSLRESRLSGVRRFLRSNDRNTLPNNILIAFVPGQTEYTSMRDRSEISFQNGCATEVEQGEISFSYDPEAPEQDRPALVVDGQHRLFGVAGLEGEDVPLLVVAMLDAPPEEQAFQFIVINNKAVKVPTTTVKSIVADYEDLEQNLLDRLVPAGITYGKQSAFLTSAGESEGSPFYGLLDWDRNRDGERIVTITALQSMLGYLRSETELIVEKDDDSIQQIFMWVWNCLKDLYADLWTSKNEKFFSKVNLVAMNEYCVDRLRSLASMQMLNLFKEDEVVDSTGKAFAHIPSELWLKEWTGVRIQDNRVVRELLQTTFEKVAANCVRERPWDQDLRLFSEAE